MTANEGLLSGVRIIEFSMLGPAAITTALADLGADVVKVESPSGDYVRRMTWPIVEGTSLMHLHVNRGKRSLAVNLRRAAGSADVGHLIIGHDEFIHWQRPGEVVSKIGTLVTKLDAQGKSMKAPQAVIDVYDAARLEIGRAHV